ncbi:MAG TPA: GNAT family N-acetyltransferase [Candidatus Woesebacteria bacterium]|nr:GNAT family N-acetyltransferase [Candidatus Woesebacteria bacterium]
MFTVIPLAISAKKDILDLEARSAPDVPYYYRYVNDVSALDYIFQHPDICQAFGVYENNVLVGWGSYRSGWAGQNIKGPGIFEISSIVVDIAYRRKGIGKMLLKRIIQELLSKSDCHTIYLTVFPGNTSALMLYLSEGFEIYDYKKDLYGPGVHRVYLQYKTKQ